MQFLKANTQVKVVIGPFVDVTDGFTPEVGITLSGADEAELIKHDAAAVTDISAATWAAITGADGYYNLTLTTSHTDTEGLMTIVVQDDSICLPVRATFMVLAEAAYDSMFTAKDTGFMDVNVKAVSEDTAAADNLEADYDGTGYNKSASTVGTVTTLTGHTAQTGDNYARLGAPAGASIAADIAAIEAQTDDIGVAGAGLSAIPWNAAWDAEVESEVNDALVVLGLDHLVNAAVVGTDITDNSIIARLVSASATADWDDFVNTTDSLQAIRDRGDAAWTTGAGTGLTALASGTAQGGTASTTQLAAGETFADNELNGNIVKITSGTGAGQARVITAYTGATDTATIYPNWTTNPDATSVYEIVEGSMNLSAISLDGVAADNVEADYDGTGYNKSASEIGTVATLTGHTAQTGDSFARLGAPAGASVSADIADILADTNELQTDDVPGLIAALNDPTAATIADAVWDELATGHTDAGKAGEQLWTDVDAILADTNELQTDDIPGTIAALNDLSAAEVNAEVVDVLRTDTIPDSYAADGSQPTIAQAILAIHQFLQERDVAGTTVTVKKPDGSTTAMTFTLNDGTSPTSITRAT